MKLSIIITYYNQPDVLAWSLGMISQWSTPRFRDTEVIFVDDGSMKFRLKDMITVIGRTHVPNLSVYRVTDDIPWNQCGARNLGAKQAKGDMLLMLDIDHQIDNVSLDELIRDGIETPVLSDKFPWYTFDRLDSRNNTPLRPGKNIFLMLRSSFESIGGYDEDLTGEYLQDRLFIWQAEQMFRSPLIHPNAVISVMVNGGSKELERKSEHNLKLIEDKIAGRVPISKSTLRFPWVKEVI